MSFGVVNNGDMGGVAMVTLVIVLALHSCFNLIIRSRGIKNWRSVEGQLEYFNHYPIYVYGGKGGFYRAYKGMGIEASYSYSYGAARFTGKRVSIIDFPPSIWAPEYRELVPALQDAYANKKPIHVLVNPDKPHQAVLATPPVMPQIKRAMLALLMAVPFLGFIYMDMISEASWVYGGLVGLILYLPFAAGLFSTAL